MTQQPLRDIFLRKVGEAIMHALISFRVTCDFPLLGSPVLTVIPLVTATAGAVFVSANEIVPGIIIVAYELTVPLAEPFRAEVGGIAASQLPPFGPFAPIPAPVLTPTSDTDFQCVVLANDTPQAPGSPSINFDYHTAIWTPNVGIA